ncbi:hypothetical protein HPB51_010158 [Rhipicephalus microplus]|uniref:Ig-like domain-containing protein n=1 Tax=Rhipicephalus microplus TaxID=6941 RepID=A0A9J6F101_RHIMP|nr:hypothetical protein HPB51_010158 [Rhipicephalus microplus]
MDRPPYHDALPEFAEPVPNVTAIVGRSVKLPCVVNNLGHYGSRRSSRVCRASAKRDSNRGPQCEAALCGKQLGPLQAGPRGGDRNGQCKTRALVNEAGISKFPVAWLRVESKTILTIHKSVITQNYRVHLSPSDRTWLLIIDSVQESDRGGYMCQVNTVPMHSQVGYLDVLVPPDIVDSESSSDVLVREGSNVTLSCRAKGYPAPRITWRREDGTPIAVGNWQEQLGSTATDNVSYEGEELSITKVSRLHMGPYLCASPPMVSHLPSAGGYSYKYTVRAKAVRIIDVIPGRNSSVSGNNRPDSKDGVSNVAVPPMIWIPNQLIGAPLGGEVVMDCNTEAFPMSINYWTLESGDLIAESAKYSLNRTENVYKVHMRLRIRRIVPEDFGAYRCFAKNSLGSTEGSIRLYEIHIPPPSKVKEPSTARIQSIEEANFLRMNGDPIFNQFPPDSPFIEYIERARYKPKNRKTEKEPS